jgi:hypothetical protein
MGSEFAGAGIGGGLGFVLSLVLLPEVTIPALVGGTLIGAAGGSGVGYLLNSIENSPESLLFTAAAIGLAVYAAKKL